MTDWESKSLGDVCEILDSRRRPVTKKDRRAGEYPYYGATGIVDYVDEFIFDEPLVLVGEDGAKWGSGEGTAFSVSGRCWVNNHAHVLRPIRASLLDEWLVYYLVHEDLSPFVSGLTVPKLNQGNLREIPIPLPPLGEQRRIVTILDEAFEGIATAKANAEKNLRNARELFDGHLEALLAQGGDRWVEAPIVECFKVRSGDFLPAKSMGSHGDVPVYGGNGIAGAHDHSNLSGDQIVIGRVGAKCGNVRHVRGEIWLTDNAFHISKYLRPFAPEFLARLLNLKKLRQTANQAAQPVISYTTIKDVVLSFPVEIDEQRRLASRLDKLEKLVEHLNAVYEQKLAALDELKKSLLHQAFSGQLRGSLA